MRLNQLHSTEDHKVISEASKSISMVPTVSE